MKKIRVLLLMLSLIIGFTGTCAYAKYLPDSQPAVLSQLAWWGGLYPEYCLPGAVRLVGADTEAEAKVDTDEAIPVKIRFKYLTFLNDLGGNHE